MTGGRAHGSGSGKGIRMGEMSKVEEVALAIIEELRRQAEDNGGTVKGESSDDVLIDGRGFDMKLAAKAGIEAMREPTAEMMVGMEDAVPALMSFASKENSPSYKAYCAGIDAALKE
jgi:hypothetical protein